MTETFWQNYTTYLVRYGILWNLLSWFHRNTYAKRFNLCAALSACLCSQERSVKASSLLYISGEHLVVPIPKTLCLGLVSAVHFFYESALYQFKTVQGQVRLKSGSSDNYMDFPQKYARNYEKQLHFRVVKSITKPLFVGIKTSTSHIHRRPSTRMWGSTPKRPFHSKAGK